MATYYNWLINFYKLKIKTVMLIISLTIIIIVLFVIFCVATYREFDKMSKNDFVKKSK
jgi:hypothetical protein